MESPNFGPNHIPAVSGKRPKTIATINVLSLLIDYIVLGFAFEGGQREIIVTINVRKLSSINASVFHIAPRMRVVTTLVTGAAECESKSAGQTENAGIMSPTSNTREKMAAT